MDGDVKVLALTHKVLVSGIGVGPSPYMKHLIKTLVLLWYITKGQASGYELIQREGDAKGGWFMLANEHGCAKHEVDPPHLWNFVLFKKKESMDIIWVLLKPCHIIQMQANGWRSHVWRQHHLRLTLAPKEIAMEWDWGDPHTLIEIFTSLILIVPSHRCHMVCLRRGARACGVWWGKRDLPNWLGVLALIGCVSSVQLRL